MPCSRFGATSGGEAYTSIACSTQPKTRKQFETRCLRC